MEFLGLDNVVSIFSNVECGKFAVIGSTPSLGKTSFALTLLKEITMNKNISSILFSLEMPKSALEKRMAEIDFRQNDCFHIFDDPKLSIEELSNILENKIKESMIKICFIDYFGILNGNRPIIETTKFLKSLAIKLNISIIVMAQISSDFNGLTPELSHYETFSNDADLIIALNKNKEQKETELIILKNLA